MHSSHAYDYGPLAGRSQIEPTSVRNLLALGPWPAGAGSSQFLLEIQLKSVDSEPPAGWSRNPPTSHPNNNKKMEVGNLATVPILTQYKKLSFWAPGTHPLTKPRPKEGNGCWKSSYGPYIRLLCERCHVSVRVHSHPYTKPPQKEENEGWKPSYGPCISLLRKRCYVLVRIHPPLNHPKIRKRRLET